MILSGKSINLTTKYSNWINALEINKNMNVIWIIDENTKSLSECLDRSWFSCDHRERRRWFFFNQKNTRCYHTYRYYSFYSHKSIKIFLCKIIFCNHIFFWEWNKNKNLAYKYSQRSWNHAYSHCSTPFFISKPVTRKLGNRVFKKSLTASTYYMTIIPPPNWKCININWWL